MICAACDEQTEVNPCASCDAEAFLAGAYRLESTLGTGAAATTYRAVRVEDGRTVAVKEMVMSRSRADKSKELFEREARVLRQLSHPQIPAYLDDFTVENGKMRSLCLVQEFVEGTTLAAELGVHRYTEEEVLEICAELAELLTYLHGLSPPVIHRDMKPRNVMRRSDGKLVLIDFGAVRDALKDADLGGSTVAGTFGYMAPEQFQGEASPATDLYGLGALAVALLTRREPHTMLDAHGRLNWREHAAVSAHCHATIDRLLRAEAAERPSSARAAMEAMRAPPPAVGLSDPRLLLDGPRVAVKERQHPEDDPFHQPPMRREAGDSVTPKRGALAVGGAAFTAVALALMIGIGGLVAILVAAPAPPPPPIPIPIEAPPVDVPAPPTEDLGSLIRQGWTHADSDPDEALKLFKVALALSPEHQEANLGAGYVHRKVGNPAAAKKPLCKAASGSNREIQREASALLSASGLNCAE